MTLYVIGAIAAVLAIGAAALQFAISTNGPAVLNAIDRMAGGARGAEMVERASTGTHDQQKVIVWSDADRAPVRGTVQPSEQRPVLLFVHGGSWRDGNPDDYGFIGRAFVPEGFVVVLAGYRLGEEGIYPAMLEDTAAAIAWTRSNIAAHGGDPDRIVLAGHSAGAYNVVTAALDTRWLEQAGVPATSIAGIIGLAGPYDFVPLKRESTMAAFGHVETPFDTQPLGHLRAGAPQMLLIHGEKDTTVKPRNTRALADGLKQAGGHAIPVFYPEMEHSDPLIALAAPWRSRQGVFDLVAGYAGAVTNGDDPSVSVQAETR